MAKKSVFKPALFFDSVLLLGGFHYKNKGSLTGTQNRRYHDVQMLFLLVFLDYRLEVPKIKV